MSRKRATSHEVAKRAGVSRTTVSFVLNNVEANISKETRQRVLQAAKELDYVPDAAARMLASRQTRTLGLVIFDAIHLQVDAFISKVLYSLTEVSREHDFRVIVEAVEDLGRDDAYLSLVQAKQIDGLIVLNPRSDDSQLPRLIDEGFPLVLVGKIKHPGAYCVYHKSAVREAVTHLISLGHERIAHITYAPIAYRSADSRLRNYRRALAEAGINADEKLIRYGNYTAQSGYEAMNSLLAAKLRPTAVFAGNDTIAIGAMSAIHRHGLRIPEDIAIVGYDDIPVAPFTIPPLSTVRTPALMQGRLAGEMLIKLLQGEKPARPQIMLETELLIRESCGAKLADSQLNRVLS